MARQSEPESSTETEWTAYAVEYVLHGYTFRTQPTQDEAEARRWCKGLDGKLVPHRIHQVTYTFEDQPGGSR